MTQEQTQSNQATLENRLLNLSAIHQTGKKIAESELEYRPSLYSQLVTLLTGKRPYEGTEEDQTRYNEQYKAVSRNVEDAIWHAQEGSALRAHNLKPLYEQEKSRLVQEVISSIREDIKGKSKAEAASTLSLYLKGTFDAPEIDQVGLDRLAQKQLAAELGISRNYTARGSMKEYESLAARSYAADYLEDTKDGYKLNEDKISKLMDNVMTGAIVYGNKFTLEKSKEAEKAKKQESAS